MNEKEYYDEIAKKEKGVKAVRHGSFVYGKWIDFIEKRAINKILQKRQLKILDVGCGNGRFFELFRRKGYKITGIDFSNELLKQIEIKDDTIIINEDYSKFKTKDRFDIVFLGVSIPNNLEKFKIFIDKSKEILKKDGMLIVMDRTYFPDGSWSEKDLLNSLKEYNLIYNKHLYSIPIKKNSGNNKNEKVRNNLKHNFIDLMILLLFIPLEIFFRLSKFRKIVYKNMWIISVRMWVFKK